MPPDSRDSFPPVLGTPCEWCGHAHMSAEANMSAVIFTCEQCGRVSVSRTRGMTSLATPKLQKLNAPEDDSLVPRAEPSFMPKESLSFMPREATIMPCEPSLMPIASPRAGLMSFVPREASLTPPTLAMADYDLSMLTKPERHIDISYRQDAFPTVRPRRGVLELVGPDEEDAEPIYVTDADVTISANSRVPGASASAPAKAPVVELAPAAPPTFEPVVERTDETASVEAPSEPTLEAAPPPDATAESLSAIEIPPSPETASTSPDTPAASTNSARELGRSKTRPSVIVMSFAAATICAMLAAFAGYRDAKHVSVAAASPHAAVSHQAVRNDSPPTPRTATHAHAEEREPPERASSTGPAHASAKTPEPAQSAAKPPVDVEDAAELAAVARAHGDLRAARTLYVEIRKVAPRYLPAALGIADITWDLGETAAARDAYAQLIEDYPQRPLPRRVLERGKAPASH